MKQRNAQYLLSEMTPGDRFYFAGDRKKQLFTLNNEQPFFTKKQVGYNIQYANCRREGVTSGNLQVEPHKVNRRVIFLRNVNDKQ